MQIVGLVARPPTPFDGQYVLEYDPERNGVAPDGRLMSAHIVTTKDVGRARRWATGGEALAFWRQVCQREPTRIDGKPNRPLTAFTVEIASPEKLARGGAVCR